jgi:hypothetical protein
MAVRMARFCSTASIIPIITRPAKIKKNVMIALLYPLGGMMAISLFAYRGEMNGLGLISYRQKDHGLLFHGISDILVSITDKGGLHES